VPGIVGFGKAVEIAMEERESEARRLRRLRGRLDRAIRDRVEDAELNGAPLPEIDEDGALVPGERERRLPGDLDLSAGGVDGGALLADLKDLAVSSGSACTSASIEPSHVLKAIGVPDALAHASIRFGLGRFTTEDEVDFAADSVDGTVRR